MSDARTQKVVDMWGTVASWIASGMGLFVLSGIASEVGRSWLGEFIAWCFIGAFGHAYIERREEEARKKAEEKAAATIKELEKRIVELEADLEARGESRRRSFSFPL